MAANRIESLDPALLRPGRIDRKIEFPLPDVKTKRHIFNIHTGRMNLSSDVQLEEFVMAKDELSSADIKALCTESRFTRPSRATHAGDARRLFQGEGEGSVQEEGGRAGGHVYVTQHDHACNRNVIRLARAIPRAETPHTRARCPPWMSSDARAHRVGRRETRGASATRDERRRRRRRRRRRERETTTTTTTDRPTDI